jgi:phosphohistidine phosphatase
MSRLFILRHAKSARAEPGMADHGRPLAPGQGPRLASIGAQIARQLDGEPLDLVLCSTARRARETVAGLEPRLDAPLRPEKRLYLAGPDRLLKVLRELPDDVQNVLICGHNPGLHQLAMALIGSAPAPPELRYDLPTAGLVVVDLDSAWTSIGADTGTLRAFSVPAKT